MICRDEIGVLRGSGMGETIKAYFSWQIRRELQQVHCELQEQRLQRQKLQEELDRLKVMLATVGFTRAETS